MKKRLFLSLVLVVSVVFGYTMYASASVIYDASISANCIADGVGGYSIDYEISAKTWPSAQELTYELTITGPSGNISENGSFMSDSGPFSGSVAVTECGTYSITGSIIWYVPWTPDPVATWDINPPISIVCECGVFDGCPRTPGYWKNHLEAWSVQELTIGGEIKTQAELLEMLTQPIRGDMDVILIKHLIAAKLNVGSSSAPICETINAADDYLSSGGGDRSIAEPLKDALDSFNNSGDCD
ncbi:MAG: hypothetical protein SVZ03_07580 [Spirochaetota bacterium]|nr:hypothetical protein [Spirochaetota bacterium]